MAQIGRGNARYQHKVSVKGGWRCLGHRESLPPLPPKYMKLILSEVRSHLATVQDAGVALCRGRYSKVQNQDVALMTDSLEMPVFTELVALRRKDGATLAATLHKTCVTMIDLLLAGLQSRECKLRVIIMVTGDTIGANENASKRLWQAMQNYKPELVLVSVIPAKCASHVSNLAVQTAICGSSRQQKRQESEICANCSRFYKHMARDYVEEWGFNLHSYLLQHANEMFHESSADRMILAGMMFLFSCYVGY